MLDHVGIYAVQSVRTDFIGVVLRREQREEQLGHEQGEVVRFGVLRGWRGDHEEIPPEISR